MNTLHNHVLASIGGILREPGGFLRHPFVVPGGLYRDELWDWDSYWIVKGLLPLMEEADADSREQFLRHAKGSWLNFMENQSENGAIPIMVKSDNPDFFGRMCETAVEHNQAKPVLGMLARDIATQTNDFRWIEPHFESLLKFHERWRSRYDAACGLLVWGSDVAIGVDSDPATYGRPEFSSAGLLLNCLYYQDLLAVAEIADALGRPADSGRMRDESARLKAAIQSECWDPVDGFYYSVDVQVHDHRSHYLPGLNKGMEMTWKTLPLKIKGFTGFLPLWCGIATREQARILVEKHLRNPEEFDSPHGIPSLARNEKMYDPGTDSANPSNWLGPVWILANHLVHEGLKRYGYDADARQLAENTVALLERDLQTTGTLHECYHPDSGQPNFNEGFMSWNVLALAMTPREGTAPMTADFPWDEAGQTALHL